MKKKIPTISVLLIIILFLLMVVTDIAISMNKWIFVVLIGMGIFIVVDLLIKLCNKKHNKK